ncbi:S8 family serine peptidase [Mucilaginibacter auburnensis]|uniref:Ig-like protein group 2 n=1 Tax=Mucilaginibacter auburnensis TaxID=1457233 RepID=A0A2H9VUL8_9SPHI|nr:S8 family serine peptidase [Mucilaginibacter auburnensis]PJJ84498.1 Ig-like protein group 2 [Mucilaginibacter auburnensis]
MKHKFLFYLFCSVACLFFDACKKEPQTVQKPVSITITPTAVTLKKDQAYLGKRLTVNIENLPDGESSEITWLSDNPRIARVTNEGIVWAEGAGETFVTATLVNGKGSAKCKVLVTDANDYKYRIILKDKGTTNLSLNQPDAFLSARAIQRRVKYHIPIDASDLPISTEYIKAIEQTGGTIVAKSKWLNTVVVNCSDEFLIDKYKALPFVKDVVLVWVGNRTSPSNTKYSDIPQTGTNATGTNNISYGASEKNITVNNGQVLHQNGFKGAGIDIAVIDAGFVNLKTNAAFSNVNIKGAKSFVYENDDPYAIDSHGIWVTSCMAVNMPGKYVGTAPEANYWLFRTEDESTEYPVEEDYWVSAAEYADSVGVDIINSSLSYTDEYSLVSARYKSEDMDGKTAFASRGANVAAAKGILIVNCAGNNRRWVGTPADSPNVLTVGSVNVKLNLDEFTAWGMTADGRIKPDVLAMGGGASVINTSGISEARNGTSYSSPIICGLAACLWQAYPKLTNKDIIDVIRKSGSIADQPAIPLGYGIADMAKAMQLAKTLAASKQ